MEEWTEWSPSLSDLVPDISTTDDAAIMMPDVQQVSRLDDPLCESFLNLDDLPPVLESDEAEWQAALQWLFEQELPWTPAPSALLPDRTGQQGQGVGDDLFQVMSQSQPTVRTAWNGKMQEHATDYNLSHNLTSVTDIYSVASSIDSFIQHLIAPVLDNADDADYVSMQIFHEELTQPIFVSYTKKQHFTAQAFLNKIFKFVQSGVSRFLMNGRLTLRLSIFKMFAGSSLRPKLAVEAETFFGRKNNVVRIVNEGHYCGYLAITLGYLYSSAKAENRQLREWRSLIAPRSTRLLDAMIHFCIERQIDPSLPFDLSQADDIQSKIPSHQLIVIRRPTPTNTFERKDKPLFKGPRKERKIIIEYVEGEIPHYNMVKKMPGYHNVDAWCYDCWVAIKPGHLCPGACQNCHSVDKCVVSVITTCTKCNIDFDSFSCYLKHTYNRVCGTRVKCTQCEVIYNTRNNKNHVCDQVMCLSCGEAYSLPPHYCFIKPKNISQLQKEDAELKVTIAFDIEARLEQIADQTFEHKANLLISHTVCDSCYSSESPKVTVCETCGTLEHVYFGDDCVKQFVSHVMDVQAPLCFKKKVKRILVISHNFCGYDGRFVLEELLNRKFIGIQSVFNGCCICNPITSYLFPP